MAGILVRAGGFTVLVVAACGGVSRAGHEDGAGTGAAGASGGNLGAGASGETSAVGGQGGSATARGGRGGSGGVRSARGGQAGRAGGSGTAALDSGGASSDDGCVTDATALEGSSFDVVTPIVEDLGIPTVVHFERTSQGKTRALFGVPGHVTALVPSVRKTEEYGEALHFDEFVLSSDAHADVIVHALDLCVSAHDTATVAGVGSLEVNEFHGDYYDTIESDFRLSGGPDTTPPELYPPYADVDPLAPPIVRVSEPLASDGTVWLDFGPQLELEPVEQEGVVVAYRIPQVLPLATMAKASPQAFDLAGHALPADDLLTTVEDPGVQPLDGFESVVLAGIVTNADYDAEDLSSPVVLTGSGVIAGARSVEIAPGLKVLFHLVRPAGMGALSLRLRAWNSGYYTTSIHLRAGVVGGTSVAVNDLDLPGQWQAGQDGVAGAAGAAGASSTGVEAAPIQSITLGLPDSGREVLFTLETPYVEEVELTAAWVIIDDIAFLPVDAP